MLRTINDYGKKDKKTNDKEIEKVKSFEYFIKVLQESGTFTGSGREFYLKFFEGRR